MGRKNTKKPGALVKLFRRKKPGLGLIVEVTDTAQMKQFTRDKFKVRFKAAAKIRERIGYNKLHEYKRDGKLTEDQYRMVQAFFLYCQDDENRRMAKVQWIRQPSAWETTITTEKTDWFPFDMLRTVSAIKSNEGG
jgi:hypothetical protein